MRRWQDRMYRAMTWLRLTLHSSLDKRPVMDANEQHEDAIRPPVPLYASMANRGVRPGGRQSAKSLNPYRRTTRKDR